LRHRRNRTDIDRGRDLSRRRYGGWRSAGGTCSRCLLRRLGLSGRLRRRMRRLPVFGIGIRVGIGVGTRRLRRGGTRRRLEVLRGNRLFMQFGARRYRQRRQKYCKSKRQESSHHRKTSHSDRLRGSVLRASYGPPRSTTSVMYDTGSPGLAPSPRGTHPSSSAGNTESP